VVRDIEQLTREILMVLQNIHQQAGKAERKLKLYIISHLIMIGIYVPILI
jgi:hypothetical protein